MGRPRSTRSAIDFGVEIGKRIAVLRSDVELTGDQLARASGVSLDTIRSIEGGRVASPGLLITTRLARALGVSLDEIVLPALDAIDSRKVTS